MLAMNAIKESWMWRLQWQTWRHYDSKEVKEWSGQCKESCRLFAVAQTRVEMVAEALNTEVVMEALQSVAFFSVRSFGDDSVDGEDERQGKICSR